MKRITSFYFLNIPYDLYESIFRGNMIHNLFLGIFWFAILLKTNRFKPSRREPSYSHVNNTLRLFDG